ncbi:hypothetical protein BP6252_10728 [Coleophoma cylindrospora]|uniref:Uncharacterized protein n=1 Tax=Coleophoma cylindrospora TaxID=1849047 RepID=A0A3D8QTH1_9HELO|nr:hypothetical protein BP6252_10728 [Coleophoma cylindrospora]
MTSAEVFESRFGNVTILKGDNYATFKHDLKKDWTERRTHALVLLCNSVDCVLRSNFRDLITARDVVAIWKELQKFDRSNDPMYILKITKEFQSQRWNPKTEGIRSFISKLQRLRREINKNKITDKKMLDQLLIALPDDLMGRVVSVFYQQDDHDLDKALRIRMKGGTPTGPDAVVEELEVVEDLHRMGEAHRAGFTSQTVPVSFVGKQDINRKTAIPTQDVKGWPPNAPKSKKKKLKSGSVSTSSHNL